MQKQIRKPKPPIELTLMSGATDGAHGQAANSDNSGLGWCPDICGTISLAGALTGWSCGQYRFAPMVLPDCLPWF